MSEILFYHLEQRPLEQVLPLLLEKTLERGWKAVIETLDEEQEKALSEILWTYKDDSFLAHNIVSSAKNTLDEEQNILITTNQDNVNGANVRFFVNGAIVRANDEYERLVYMFDGHNSDAVQSARNAWKELSKKKIASKNILTYWQQNNLGVWQKKRETNTS